MAQPKNGAARRRPASRGFTIIEVLVAASILVVALLGIASVLPTANMTLHRAGQISKAVALAQHMLETIKNEPFINVVNYHGVDTRTTGTWPLDVPDPPVPGTTGNFMGNTNILRWRDGISLFLASGAGITGGLGTISVTTVATDGTGNPILRRVTVVVGWTEGGSPYTVQLSTLASAI